MKIKSRIQPFIQAQITETSKLRVTGLCAGNSPVTSEFPAQRASNAENVSIWCRHQAPTLHIEYDTQLPTELCGWIKRSPVDRWWVTLKLSLMYALWCLWCLWCTPEQLVQQAVESPGNWDVMTFMWRHCNVLRQYILSGIVLRWRHMNAM